MTQPLPDGIAAWAQPGANPPPANVAYTPAAAKALQAISGNVPSMAPPPSSIPADVSRGTMGQDTKDQWRTELAKQRVGQQVSYQGPPGGAATGGGGALLPPAASGPATPAGMQPSTESIEVKGGVPITKALAGSEADLQGADQELALATKNQGLAQPSIAANRAAEEAAYKLKAADVAAQQAKDFATATTEENWKRDKAHAAYDLAISKGVDPNRYLHDMSLGGKFATLASVALSGLGSGIQGIWGSNPGNGALKMVQDGIERDVREQTEAIDRKGKLADAADNHVAAFMKEGLNKQQAQQAAASLMWGDFQKTLDQKAAMLPSTNRLQAAQLQQAIAAKKDEHDMAFAKETGAVATTKVENKWKAASGGGAGDDERKAYHAYADAGLKYNAEHPDKPIAIKPYGEWHGVRGGSGAVSAGAGPAGVKTSARLAMGQAAADDATKALDEVADIEKNHYEFFAAGKEKGAGAVDRARAAMNLARVPPGEIDRLFPKGYNPTDVHVTGGAAQRIVEAKRLIAQQQEITNTAVAHTQGRAEPEETEPGP